jgi:ABC-type uncharacterized transport system permease subunit
MKKFFSQLFNDNNTINEKAVIGFLAFVMMCIFAVADIVTGTLGKELVIQEFVFDAFKILTIACFGIASVDKWINKDKKEEGAE